MDNCYWQVSFPSLTIGEILRWKWEKKCLSIASALFITNLAP
jgi:hypothetical protein